MFCSTLDLCFRFSIVGASVWLLIAPAYIFQLALIFIPKNNKCLLDGLPFLGENRLFAKWINMHFYQMYNVRVVLVTWHIALLITLPPICLFRLQGGKYQPPAVNHAVIYYFSALWISYIDVHFSAFVLFCTILLLRFSVSESSVQNIVECIWCFTGALAPIIENIPLRCMYAIVIVPRCKNR